MRCAVAAQAMTRARVWENDVGSLPRRLPPRNSLFRLPVSPERERLSADSPRYNAM